MKLNKFTHLLVIGLVLTVAATGCKKKPTPLTDLPPSARTSGPKDVPPGRPINPNTQPFVNDRPPGSDNQEPGGIKSNSPDSHLGWIEDAITLKPQTVHFDFDSSVLKASEKPKVAAVADHLKANHGKAVRVEGNCDERGTEEYNRSLGERRALAVREELVRLGIDPKDVDTISYGKDKPEVQGHDESAWRQNRRDDFILLSPPPK
ncbi:MAG: OmpA family protein [Verrucomicrobia bacterium]|nr:OmpA family protein [Verrucomicrobiota bacterium]